MKDNTSVSNDLSKFRPISAATKRPDMMKIPNIYNNNNNNLFTNNNNILNK